MISHIGRYASLLLRPSFCFYNACTSISQKTPSKKESLFRETQLGFPNLLRSETFLGFLKKSFRGLGNPKVHDIVSDENIAPETDYPFLRRPKV